MRIFVINPNTTESMTDHIRRELIEIKRSETEIKVVNPEHGPVSIESAYDEALAGPPTPAPNTLHGYHRGSRQASG